MKKYLSVVLILLVSLSLFSCSGNEEKAPAETDINALAAALKNGLEFGAELEESPDEIAYMNYGLEEELCEDAIICIGGNATADELAIFKAKDEQGAAEVSEAVQYRIDYLLDGFGDYNPAEVPKIKNAYVRAAGNIIILCIGTNVEKADEIVDSFIK